MAHFLSLVFNFNRLRGAYCQGYNKKYTFLVKNINSDSESK